MTHSTESGPPPAEARPAARRDAPLAIDPETFRALGHRLIDDIAARLAAQPSRPVARIDAPDQVRSALEAARTLPEAGGDPAELLARASRLVFEHGVYNGHPRFFGYITASPAPIGMLGDLLGAAANPNVGGWMLAPAS